ncbi:SCO2322 family protein [Streptomyces sp. NPDC052042]|uniref:SCO2322 family protein n=1 Tax=Streptomyces sp. NPDC052042 TaxID=3365683 RepID=UPI0037CF66FF
MRRSGGAAALLAVVLGAILTVLGAGPAQAVGYRYWSFWEGSGSGWTYATQGPALVRPDDGTVQGFRFSVSEDSEDAARPRHAPDFAKICANTPAEKGSKRVALVIDPGTAADAPDGQSPPALRTACALVAPDASTAEALASVAKPLRYDSNALLCAISGYPASGCGEQVSDEERSASSRSAEATAPASTAASGDSGGSEDSKGGGPSTGVLLGAGAVLVLGTAAAVRARRRG